MLAAKTLTPTVFVVDDDPPTRESLIGLLNAMGFNARSFSSAKSFHHFYDQNQPGCLVLDIRMPVQNGLELYRQLLQENKRLPVIFITAHADVSTAVAAMKTGAVEFLEKPFDRETISALVGKALALDAHWREQDANIGRINSRISRLNSRDQETLQLILAGASNKSMATKLFISERAVEMRRAAIMRKLEVKSLAELLEVAITHRVLAELNSMRGASGLY